MKKQMKTGKQVYIIEHLEPKLFDWCIFEYENISKIVGKENLWFTNLKSKNEAKKLEKFGRVFSESVRDLKLLKDNLKQACVLDPEAKKLLNTKDAKRFKYFIFGGILGDYPPRKRTKEELTKFLKNAIARNIGKEQMSTDNAVFTVARILGGKKFKEMKFKDGASIKINEFESIDLPYRYNLVRGKPFISKKVVNYLKKKKGF